MFAVVRSRGMEYFLFFEKNSHLSKFFEVEVCINTVSDTERTKEKIIYL